LKTGGPAQETFAAPFGWSAALPQVEGLEASRQALKFSATTSSDDPVAAKL
jgi:hypothetical protein